MITDKQAIEELGRALAEARLRCADLDGEAEQQVGYINRLRDERDVARQELRDYKGRELVYNSNRVYDTTLMDSPLVRKGAYMQELQKQIAMEIGMALLRDGYITFEHITFEQRQDRYQFGDILTGKVKLAPKSGGA